MRVRLAKPSDAKTLAEIYGRCSAETPAFLVKLGKAFLVRYHQILLEEKHSFVLCVEEDDGRTVGFVSGTLHAEEHMAALRHHKFALLLASLPALLRNPRLIGEVLARQRSESAHDRNGGYVVLLGCRLEFWGCLPEARAGGKAIVLLRAWLSLARLLGAQEIRFEVNSNHEPIQRIHRSLGARVARDIVTPDGKARLIMEYQGVQAPN